MKRFEGRTAFITGGGRGIGRAITLRLAEEGAKVFAGGRDVLALNDVVSEAATSGGIVCPLVGNILDLSFIESLPGYFTDGGFDILVNNVGGVQQFGIFHELSDHDWYQVFNENLMVSVRVTKILLPLLLSSRHASIVNTASVAGIQAGYFNCHYGAMKAAMVHWTKYLANNYGRDGIRANAVAPSTIKGGVWDRDVASKSRMDNISVEEAERRMTADVLAKSVLNRIGTPEDVAAAVAFLASDDARMITGSVIKVDGGTVKSI